MSQTLEFFDDQRPRKKIKLVLDPGEPYVEPPPKTCLACEETRDAWNFMGEHAEPICLMCLTVGGRTAWGQYGGVGSNLDRARAHAVLRKLEGK
jgi:hypothetical protein